ncbi:phosphonate ABC transporter ATP-binding protein [Bradyrhizobium neotropicale]|uniref:Phosphonate ABC transporter ATP-binding protein n=1 Tax=Bradyrhizobium neotropicale TaxID=1497615 RepID=A0A176ZEP6_9BRAD|nr:phosphonate ABC transporter ATP-binding protein [Bradyrhizobium neotropicale]OAF19150.1 phosphonate ABC transporter ATP-binding protein [Bradyrhizobium neotropicale]
MLKLEGLTTTFGKTCAVQDVSLSIPAGQFVGVIGRSGAGKSTLLRTINRLAEPTSGRVIWRDADMTGVSGSQLRDWRRRCSMVFQQFNLVGRLDVLNNVLMGRLTQTPFWRAVTKTWSSEDRALAFAALDQFDISGLASQRADQLSGGQQQRVAICRALMQDPEIILADEPVASLDPRNTGIVMDALALVNRQFGLTVLCNLHSLDLARGYCDRLVGMANGRVVFDGTPAALTDAAARELYGMDADEVIGPDRAAKQPVA